MSNSIIEAGFVLPHEQEKLNGELGLTLHEIAKSLQVPFKNVKKKLDRMIEDNRINGAAPYGVSNDSNGLEVTSYVLPITEAKFFVAKYDNDIGDAYTRFLIQCEAVLLSKIKEEVSVKRFKNDDSSVAHKTAAEVGKILRERNDPNKTDHTWFFIHIANYVNEVVFGKGHEEEPRQNMTSAQTQRLNEVLSYATVLFATGVLKPTKVKEELKKRFPVPVLRNTKKLTS